MYCILQIDEHGDDKSRSVLHILKEMDVSSWLKSSQGPEARVSAH